MMGLSTRFRSLQEVFGRGYSWDYRMFRLREALWYVDDDLLAREGFVQKCLSNPWLDPKNVWYDMHIRWCHTDEVLTFYEFIGMSQDEYARCCRLGPAEYIVELRTRLGTTP